MRIGTICLLIKTNNYSAARASTESSLDYLMALCAEAYYVFGLFKVMCLIENALSDRRVASK
jgi:hypothetical protein